MADDLSVVNAARVSFGTRRETMEERDAGLVRFLMRERHGTPFEHNFFRFHIKAPLFVTREWQRHRIGSFNERSGRYSELPDEFYVPAASAVRTQVGKPGAYTFEPMPTRRPPRCAPASSRATPSPTAATRSCSSAGVAKEVARSVLPVGLYTEFYWSVNARSLMNFLSLRNAAAAQYEIRVYAEAAEQHFAHAMPVTHASFVGSGTDGSLSSRPRRELEVADLGGGVHRVTQPLPWALDHVHCYAVDDADGWTLIDCGLGTPGTGRRWEQALALLGHPRVRRLVITHYHPDHIGASTRLAEITGAEEIVQGTRDRELTVRTWLDLDSGARFQRYLLAHGMPLEDAERSAGEEDEMPIAPVEPTRLVDEGDTLDLAGEPFDVLVLPGHADGHIALLGRHSGRLFGGDVLLDEITPNVGRWEDNEPDPLGRYLAHARAHRGARAVRRVSRAPRRDRPARGARAGDRDAPRRPARRARARPCARARAAPTTSLRSSGAARSASTSSASPWPRRSRTSSGSSCTGRAVQVEPSRWRAASAQSRRARRTWRAGSA